jgi:hypothetical protein
MISKDKCSIYVLVNSNISIIDIGSQESIHLFLNPLPLCEADGIEFYNIVHYLFNIVIPE